MNYEKVTKENFQIKINEDGAPLFTQDNFKLINTFLNYDSNYNIVENTNDGMFSNTYGGILLKLKEEFFKFKRIEDYDSEQEYMGKDPLYLVIVSIDKLNSTHLASEGQKGGNRGRIRTAVGVYSIINFRERLYNADPKLVNEIARFGGKNNFSFASKFCAYLCRYIFKDTPQENNYCIYDEVIQSVLPYFAYKYGGKSWEDTYNTTIRKGKKENHSIVWKYKDSENENSYDEYINLIKSIINKIREESKIDITFEAFDHLLWYFFKGQQQKRQKLLDKLPYKDKANLRYFATSKGTINLGKISEEELFKINETK